MYTITRNGKSVFLINLDIFSSVLVSAGSQGIPQLLQKCQSQAKELQRNQTDLYSRFINLNTELSNLNSQVGKSLFTLLRCMILVVSKHGTSSAPKCKITVLPTNPYRMIRLHRADGNHTPL